MSSCQRSAKTALLQPGDVAFPENPNPGMDGMTRSKESLEMHISVTYTYMR
nr:hypothetical protein [Dyadobacter sp. 3J3]